MPNVQEFIDGFTTLEGGVDSGRAPENLAPNQAAFAINATVRGSFIKSRPGFRQPRLGYDSTETQAWIKGNRYQGAGYYNLDGRTPVNILGVGGKLFEKRMSNNDAYIHDITPNFPANTVDITGAGVSGLVDRNSNRQPKIWTQQADVYLIIQDGLGKAIIYDGSKARRAVHGEVPVGTCMAYGYGRLVVANGNEFAVGDIYGGGTQVYSFLENTFLNEGGAFTLPADMGNITGMVFTAKQDTATGQGILLVFAEHGTASVDLSGPRANWKSSSIQQVALIGIGATSGQSIALINGDVFFRSDDGMRSYRDSRAEQSSLGRTPISYEINRILDYDTPALLDQVSAVYFDNRYLMTVSPKPNAEGAIFRGLAVMDFTPVTSNRNPAPACFDGLWTGIQPVALTCGKYPTGDRCFAFCTDDVNGNQIWEITKKDAFDNGDQLIESSLETRLMKFAANPFYTSLVDQDQYKNLQTGRIWISDLRGLTQFELMFRPDQYPFWAEWITFAVGSPSETCGQVPICTPVPMIPPQYRPGLQLPRVPETCDANGSRDMLKKGYSFQIRIKWTGHACIPRFLLMANGGETLNGECIAGTPFVAPECGPLQLIYFSFPLTGACPSGKTGGPFEVPYGEFTSLISQDEANAQAAAYLATLIAGCQTPTVGEYDRASVTTVTPASSPILIPPYPEYSGGSSASSLIGSDSGTDTYNQVLGYSISGIPDLTLNGGATTALTYQNVRTGTVTVNIAAGTLLANGLTFAGYNGGAYNGANHPGLCTVSRTITKNGVAVGSTETVTSSDGADHSVTTAAHSIPLAPGDVLIITTTLVWKDPDTALPSGANDGSGTVLVALEATPSNAIGYTYSSHVITAS